MLGLLIGSGKIVVVELVMWWVFWEYFGLKVVYIVFMKVFVCECVKDWGDCFVKLLGLRLVELMGDNIFDIWII